SKTGPTTNAPAGSRLPLASKEAMTDERDDQEQQPERPDTDETSSVDRELASLREQLEATRAERDDNYNLALRAQAELENYRRRVNREREEDLRYRALPLVKDLLPVIDNLHRAVQAASTTGNAGELIRGVEMVLKQCDDVLTRHEVKPIAAENAAFDPNFHDALTQVPTTEVEPMTILQEVERGYTLHDRVLRPSKVVVAMAPPQG
ncbi:MAG: nucleotide exchange factor GrpE, partial [Planctomycetaceae bacterium]